MAGARPYNFTIKYTGYQGHPTINAELGIANLPETLIRAWEATLAHCRQALAQLLNDHHSQTIDFHSGEVDR